MTESPFRTALLRGIATAGIRIPSKDELSQLELYYQLLDKWNQRINLTALPLGALPPPQTVERLFIEPLVGAALIEETGLTALDIGSGAGSPALPLKIVRPRLRLTLVEAKTRKTAFLQEAVRTLRLQNLSIRAERVEQVAQGAASLVELVTIRAVKLNQPLIDTVLRLLVDNGRLMTFGIDDVSGFEVLERRELPRKTRVTLLRRLTYDG